MSPARDLKTRKIAIGKTNKQTCLWKSNYQYRKKQQTSL